MALREDEFQKLERALIEAYRAQPDIPLDGVHVTQNVMRNIRQATGDGSRWVPSVSLDQLVWRTATIAAGVVLVVTALTAGAFRSMTSGESAGLLAEEFESAPLFGD